MTGTTIKDLEQEALAAVANLAFALEMDVQLWESQDPESPPPASMDRQKVVTQALNILRGGVGQ